MSKITIGIIGFGRFGQLLASILKQDFALAIFDSGEKAQDELKNFGYKPATLSAALFADVVFYCVPISDFENTFKQHMEHLGDKALGKLFIDVLSVKVHPKQVFEKYLPDGAEALLTHPMFGPDSVKIQGLDGQPLIMDRFCMTQKNYQFWRDYFAGKKLNVIEMSADDHDRFAARSQGLTHFIGRVLGEFGFDQTPIDSLGAKKLHEIESQVLNDTWQLFEDLQTYNPYTREMRVRLANAQTKVFNILLPNRINSEKLIVGIQGGPGSFNEEAALYYLSRTASIPYEIKYLYTTENVLRALYEGDIDRGQFAIHNSVGGAVAESITAMSRYRFNIIEEYGIKISHALMAAPAADFNKVDTIMTHPQTLKQCRNNLAKKYERLKQTSGANELIDHSKVAASLAAGDLPASIATMGSKQLAQIYGLQIIEEDLQDLPDNFTSFLFVERPSNL